MKNSNEKYVELQREYHKILNKNENITWVLEGNIEGRTLSNTECFELSKLVQIYYELKEIFFSGSKQAYFFFKKLEF